MGITCTFHNYIACDELLFTLLARTLSKHFVSIPDLFSCSCLYCGKLWGNFSIGNLSHILLEPAQHCGPPHHWLQPDMCPSPDWDPIPSVSPPVYTNPHLSQTVWTLLWSSIQLQHLHHIWLGILSPCQPLHHYQWVWYLTIHTHWIHIVGRRVLHGEPFLRSFIYYRSVLNTCTLRAFTIIHNEFSSRDFHFSALC